MYLTFSPRFERIWLESKKRLPEYVAQKPANMGLRSQYALRLYSWAQKYVTVGTKRVSLEELRKVLGLESVKDPEGKIIQETPLPVWANFRREPWIPRSPRSIKDGLKDRARVAGAINQVPWYSSRPAMKARLREHLCRLAGRGASTGSRSGFWCMNQTAFRCIDPMQNHPLSRASAARLTCASY